MAAQDNLNPQQFYHSSSPRNRASIQQQGLRTDFSADEDFGTTGGQQVYLSKGAQSEDRWGGQDVWKVNAHGLPLIPDLEPGDYSTSENIGPERLSLHRKAGEG